MFITDLFFNFNTAYMEGPNYVIDRGMIASNYLRSWFPIDSLSSFPVELVDLAAAEMAKYVVSSGESEEENTLLKSLKALRMFRLLRMLKLLKIQQARHRSSSGGSTHTAAAPR